MTYRKLINEEVVSTDVNAELTFQSDGAEPHPVLIKLQVIDSLGLVGEDSIIVSLNNTPPQVNITSIEQNELYAVDGITFKKLQAEVIDLEHAQDELFYSWQLSLGHNSHEHAEPVIHEKEATIQILPTTCGVEKYYYRVRLIVEDAGGLKSISDRILFPDCDAAFIDLIHFDHDLLNESVQLNWVTSYEEEVDNIIIERLINGQEQWETIGELTPKNLGRVRSTYDFLDQDPLFGSRKYRLRLLGIEGQEVYSQVIDVDFIGKETLAVYPNPSDGFITLLFGKIIDQSEFTLFDASGKQVVHRIFNADGPLSHRIDIRQLTPGSYLYYMFNGQSSITDQLLIIN